MQSKELHTAIGNLGQITPCNRPCGDLCHSLMKVDKVTD